jgi:hypothetical protein
LEARERETTMSLPTFLTPIWGLMGLLAIPLVVLYLLRQRRPDLRVSSTLLWSRTLADMQASTPFQKLRRNLLLLLQLLILAALVFTLMRPVVQARAGQSKAGVIVIDATASMQSHDGDAGGVTRLERAKTEAKKLVDAMRPGDRYMLIADGGGLSQVRSGFSSSKSELKTLIDSVKPGDTSTDLSESLLLASTSLRAIGAASTGATKTEALAAGKVYLFSDGAGVRVPDAMGTDNSLLQFVKIGSSDHSVGITALSVMPLAKEPRSYQVFVGLKNSWDVERKVGIMLALNEKTNYLPGQARFVTLPPHGQGAAVFEKVVSDPGKLFVEADDTDDDFPLDNTAYGLLEPTRLPRVALVTPGNEMLEKFIKTLVSVGKAQGEILAPAAYTPALEADLVIFDEFLPPADKLPRIDTLILRPSVAGAGDVGGFKVLSESDSPVVLRTNRESPLMAAVELNELRLSHALTLERDPQATELVSAPESPLIAYKDIAGVRRYFVAFSPLLESNWYKLPTFLIFLQNVLNETRMRHYIGLPEILAAGTPARLWDIGGDAPGARVRISQPDGSVVAVESQNNSVEYAGTDKVGFYDVSAPNNKQASFAVNVLSATESDIRPRSLQSTSGGNIEEATSILTINKEIWPWVAVAALGFLLLEWWVYHRRIA